VLLVIAHPQMGTACRWVLPAGGIIKLTRDKAEAEQLRNGTDCTEAATPSETQALCPP